MRIRVAMAVSATLLAAPVAAQWTGIREPVGASPASGGVDRELGRIRGDIAAGQRSGQLSRHEARQLRRENSAIGTLQDRFAQGGISPGEQWELDGRARAEADRVGVKRLSRKQ